MKAKYILNCAYLVLVLLVFSTGFFFGLKHGAVQLTFYDAPMNAVSAMNILKMLRSNDVKGAIPLIEQQLDYNIITHRDFLNNKKLFVLNDTMSAYVKATPQIMSLVADYRLKFPLTKWTPDKDKLLALSKDEQEKATRLAKAYSEDLERALLHYKSQQNVTQELESISYFGN